MATIHLTRDNHRAVLHTPNDSLAGVASNTGSHLVVVRQISTWNNKEFLATPTEMRYTQGWSLGKELHASEQGGWNVWYDTNTLVGNVRNSIDAHTWKSGNCALFLVASRSRGPYAWYDYYAHPSASMPNPSALSEFGASVVAYKFNLHHLHLSTMTTGSYIFSAYLRVWAPSLVIANPSGDSTDGILFVGGLYNSASKLKVKLFESLPSSPSWSVSDSGDAFEFAGNCNNGQVVAADTTIYGQMANYNPFNDKMAYSTDGNSSRIYTTTTDLMHPVNYYHDFQITNTDNLDFLKKNPGEFWVLAHFHIDNAFSRGDSTNFGLKQGYAATVFAERVELVLKCTHPRFNYQ